MSLIENEIIKLKECVRDCSGEGGYSFPESDPSIQSYYLNYCEAKHLDHMIVAYDSERIKSIREELQAMWSDDEVMRRFIPVVVAAFMKLYNSEVAIKDIDLFNYMM